MADDLDAFVSGGAFAPVPLQATPSMPSLAPVPDPLPVGTPAAPASPTLSARRPRLGSIGDSHRCRMHIPPAKLGLFGGQDAMARFEDRGGLLYCTAPVRGASTYWGGTQVCKDCHDAGRAYRRRQHERAQQLKASAAQAASGASASGGNRVRSNSFASSSSSSTPSSNALRLKKWETSQFVKLYFQAFQDLTVRLGPDPLAKMKYFCTKIMSLILKDQILDIRRVGKELRAKTQEFVPDKPDLFKLVCGKAVPKLKQKREQRMQQIRQLQQQRSAAAQGGAGAAPNAAAAGAQQQQQQQQKQSGGGGRPLTEFEKEFGKTVDQFFVAGDMSLNDELNVLSWPSFPAAPRAGEEEGGAEDGEGGSSDSISGVSSPTDAEEGTTEGTFMLNEDGEYQLMIDQAQPSERTLRVYSKLANKKARLPRDWREDCIVPLAALRARVDAACKTAPVDVALGGDQAVFEREKGVGHFLQRAVEHVVRDTLEGLCALGNHRHASRDTSGKAVASASGGRRTGSGMRRGSAGGEPGVLGDGPLNVYKIQVEKLSDHAVGNTSNPIHEKIAHIVQRENPAQFLRWRSQKDQDEGRRKLKRKRNALKQRGGASSGSSGSSGSRSRRNGGGGSSSGDSGGGGSEVTSLETKGTTMQDIVEALLEKRVQDRPMSEHIFDGAAFECEAVTKTDFPEVKADATKVAAAAATTSSRRKSLRVASAAAALAPATRLKLVTLEDFKTYVTRSDHQNVFSGTVVADLFRR